jgi:hypothetical protein
VRAFLSLPAKEMSHGYEHFLEVINDEDDPEHEEML